MALMDTQRRLDAECAVIGALLIDERIVREVLATVEARDFVSTANQAIYQAARALLRDGLCVDAITVRDKLGDTYTETLLQLMEITPTSANWREYATIMREQAALSRIRELAEGISSAQTLEDCRSLVADLSQEMSSKRGVESASMLQLLDGFEHRQTEGSVEGQYIKFGIPSVDDGSYVERGDVVIIGGYPSDGKTALALSSAYHMAQTLKVGFFSLETDSAKIADRLIAHAAQIDFNRIKQRKMEQADWDRFVKTAAEAQQRNLTVIKASGMTAAEIQAITIAHGFDAIFLDYIQLVRPEGDPKAGNTQLMAGVSMSMHAFAQRQGVLVVELAQLARSERGKWRPPDMHDLKETGQLEQDADQILLVYRPDPKSDYDQETVRHITVAKNKEGRRGGGLFVFDGLHQTFAPMEVRYASDKRSSGAGDQLSIAQIGRYVADRPGERLPF